MLKRLSTSLTIRLLAAFFALMALFFAAGGYAIARSEVASAEHGYVELLNRRAKARSEAIKHLVTGTRDRVELAALDSDVRRAMSRVRSAEEAARLLDPADPDALALAEELKGLALHRERDGTRQVFLAKVEADPTSPLHGKVVAQVKLDNESLLGRSFAKSDWFVKASQGEAVVSTLEESPEGRSMFFASPVRAPGAAESDKPIGVLVMELSSEVLDNDLYTGQKKKKDGSTGSAFVIDENGTVLHELTSDGPQVNGCADEGASITNKCLAEPPAADAASAQRCRDQGDEVTKKCRRMSRETLAGEVGALCLADWLRANPEKVDTTTSHDEAGPGPPDPKTKAAHWWRGCTQPGAVKSGWSWRGKTALIGADLVDPWTTSSDPGRPASDKSFPRWFVVTAEDAEAWRDDRLQKQLRATSLLTGAALFATCAVMFIVLRRMVRYLHELLGGTMSIASGDLDARIPVRTRDELGQLAEGFNDMAASLAAALTKLETARGVAEEARAVAERERATADAATERANEANEAKSTFLANMSHELRTPLNAIIGYSEMLAEDSTDDMVIADLQKIRSAGKHLLALISDILDISKIEAGKMTLFYENLDVRSMADDVAATMQPLVGKNTNKLVIKTRGDLGSIRADVMKLRQSLFNLLSNATKFTSNGTITLDVRREKGTDKDHIIFAISDTGIGITEEQMSRLFQAFSQADASTTRKFGGTGLGLVLTKKFIELMGGTLEVTSVANEGTTFTITLPVEPLPEDTKLEATEKKARNVLVIDDDPASRELMQRALVKAGFGVRTAASGEEGLELARLNVPDAILLDVAMPGTDGWSVLNSAKEDALLRNVPVIMTSMLDDRERGFALGATDYVSKPVDWEHLSTVLRKICGASTEGHVLVVDDDPASREMARRTLEKVGYAVHEAENGRDALEQIERERPLLILLDLMMPELSGFDVVARLQKSTKHRTIPVVVMTAKDLTEEDRARLTAGVQHVYQKGAFDREELIAQVRGLVSSFPKSGV